MFAAGVHVVSADGLHFAEASARWEFELALRARDPLAVKSAHCASSFGDGRTVKSTAFPGKARLTADASGLEVAFDRDEFAELRKDASASSSAGLLASSNAVFAHALRRLHVSAL